MKNRGKIFEEDFKASVPSYVLLYRLPDSAQSFGGGSSLRFSPKNPFDYLLWDSVRHRLYAFELKTVAGNRISFEREKCDAGEIHLHQINGLNYWSMYDGVTGGFIIEFRETETTIFLHIKEFNRLINALEKKSFTIKDLDRLDIQYYTIKQKIRKTRYRYDIDNFLSQIKS